MMEASSPGLAFWLLAALLLAGAVGCVTLRNMVHAALGLALTLVAAGGLFLNLEADLLAGFQVLIYVGAVITLLLVAIMVIANVTEQVPIAGRARAGWPLLLSVGTGLGLCLVLAATSWTANPALVARPYDHTRQSQALSMALLDPYLLPFEVASVLLLVALLGAVVIAQHVRRGEAGGGGDAS